MTETINTNLVTESPFLEELVLQIRAQDTYGIYQQGRKSS